ncbi:RidA family protein [Larkinella rosea]|uniref:RidA family protein n=1 Tax=Larkinella rosea TaxID=2025312 RepID=A0A3P1BDT6_9BACT|nr:RidA family protein [Larkinella rosea]
MQTVETPNAPLAAGHYAQATVWNDLIFVSGQLPIDPVTKEKLTGSIDEQTRQVLENVKAILDAAGSDLAHVLKTTVYIADIALWDQVNAAYAGFFGEHKPARAVVPTNQLHYGFLIEIEAIAVRKAP